MADDLILFCIGPGGDACTCQGCRARAAIDAMESRCAEAYQAVGGLAMIAGLSEHPDVIRILDVLAYGKTEDGIDLLPWPKDKKLQAAISAAS